MSIKYYQLAKDEEPPDEFCVIRDIGGEPSEYMFYVPEAENAKLRELSSIMLKCIKANERKALICWECPMHKQFDELRSYCCLEHEAKKMGVEADE